MIVEDDADSAELFAKWLQDAGLRVSVVSDAELALIFAPVLRPAVVVIDLGLPTIDGIALIGQLREIGNLSCQYVAVTAYGGVRLPVLCQAAGFSAFFQKPVHREALVKSVFGMASLEASARSH